jgi:hypothetical protein
MESWNATSLASVDQHPRLLSRWFDPLVTVRTHGGTRRTQDANSGKQQLNKHGKQYTASEYLQTFVPRNAAADCCDEPNYLHLDS